MSNPSGQLALKDIASLAGVTRAAVSNWRSRNDDFPSPVEGSPPRRPLFDLQEILGWLEQQDLLPPEAKKKETEVEIWGVTNLLSGELPTRVDASVLVLYLLGLRKQGDAAWETITSAATATDLVRALKQAEAPRGVTHISGLEVFDQLERSLKDTTVSDLIKGLNGIVIDDYGEAASIVIDRLLGIGGRGDLSALGTSNSPQSTLLINAAATTLGHDDTVFDPACGIGGTLLGLQGKQNQLALVGNDIECSPVAIAQLRSFLGDIPATFTCSDSLRSEINSDLLAHTVVIEPPLGLNIDRGTQQTILGSAGVEASGSLMSDELFIYAALGNLSQGGYAYVLTSVGAGSRTPSKQVRQELVARGLVEAVIQLPPKFLPYTGIATLLWVLHRPEGRAEESVVIADATGATSPEQDVAQWLADIRAGQKTTIPSRKLMLAELITNDGSIYPSAQLHPQIDSREVWDDLEHSLIALRTGLIDIQGVDIDVDELSQMVPSSRGSTDLNQMIARKEIIRLRGKFTLRGARVPQKGVEALLLPFEDRDNPATITASDDQVWAQNGDILLPDNPMFPARVFSSDDSQWVVPTGMSVLRIKDPALNSQYVIACINAPFNKAAVKSSTTPRRDLTQIQLPLLDTSKQEQLVAAVKQLAVVQDKIDRLSTQASKASELVLNAVRYGFEEEKGGL